MLLTRRRPLVRTLVRLGAGAACGMSLLAPFCQAQTPPENWVYPKAVAAWDDATKQAQEAAAKKVFDDLKAAAGRGDKQFTIPPGDYRIGGELLPALVITANDLDIRAEGVNLWFNGRVPRTAVTFQGCRNVRLHGATFDADPFCNSQGEVLSFDPGTKTATVRIDPGFPVPDAQWLGKPGSSKAIFCDPQGAFRHTPLDWVKEVTPVGAGQYQVSFVANRLFTADGEVRPGDRLVFPDRSMGHLFAVNGCEKVTLEDLTVYAAPHMAFTELDGAGGNVYRRCKVVRRPDTRRLIACNADVFHSIKVEHGPLIEQCEFSAACDDLINVHSFFSCVLEQGSPTTLVVTMFNNPDIEAGANLEFYDPGTMQTVGAARVLKVTPRPDLEMAARALPGVLIGKGWKVADIFHDKCFPVEVTLDQAVNLPKFALAASSQHAARGTVIRGNSLHDTIGRGVFLKGDDGLIENNDIARTGLPGVFLATDRFVWEGPPPRRVTVRGNRLFEVALGADARTAFNGMNAAIAVGNKEEGGGGPPSAAPVRNIQIEHNQIARTPVIAVLLENAKDCVITNNVFVQLGFLPALRGASGELRDKAGAIHLTRAQDIHIADNVQQPPPPKGLVILGKETANCGPQK